MSELMTFLSNKKVVTNDMESATTTLAQRVGFEPTGDCSHDGFRVLSPSVNYMVSSVSFSQPCTPTNPHEIWIF